MSPRPKAPALTFPSTPPVPVTSASADERGQHCRVDPKSEKLPYVEGSSGDGKTEMKLGDAAHPANVRSPEVDRDDISVPPIGLEGGFFDEPMSAESSLEIDIAVRDPRARKMTPGAARRRARFAKYVSVAVGLATALCAAALVKNTMARGNEAPQVHSRLTETAAAGPGVNPAATTESTAFPSATANSDVAGKPTAVELTHQPETNSGRDVAGRQAAEPGPTALQGGAPAPTVADSAQATPPAQEPSAPSDTAPPSDPVAVDPKVIAKEASSQKAKSRGALEWGKVADASSAGERSVELDPTDAEAWLILGAAYQQKGDSSNARRSFKACIEKGKRGPKNDCAAMLH
ncbi:MAG: hypothetical protein M3O46_17090 [Myxococcota bacterium]|nr:hypothetical protein [Myxococcota bacterium]